MSREQIIQQLTDAFSTVLSADDEADDATSVLRYLATMAVEALFPHMAEGDRLNAAYLTIENAKLREWQRKVADALGVAEEPTSRLPWSCAGADDAAEYAKDIAQLAQDHYECPEFPSSSWSDQPEATLEAFRRYLRDRVRPGEPVRAGQLIGAVGPLRATVERAWDQGFNAGCKFAEEFGEWWDEALTFTAMDADPDCPPQPVGPANPYSAALAPEGAVSEGAT